MIAFAADLHLTPLTWNDYPEMRGDAYFAWDQVVSWCVANRPSALFLGGDVFDKSRPDAESVVRFQQGIEKLRDAGVSVVAIEGQHDRSSPPWTTVAPYVIWIGDGESRKVAIGDVTANVVGYDCTSANILHSCLENDHEKGNTPDILVIHQLCKEAIPFEGAWDFDQSWSDAPLILAGDYHGAETFGRVVYSGATTMRKINERGPKSFVVVRPRMKKVGKPAPKKKAKKKAKKTKKAKSKVDAKIKEVWDGSFEIERIPLITRDVIELTIMTDDDFAAAIDRLAEPLTDKPAPIDKPVVYARISDLVDGVITRLEKLAEEAGFFFKYDMVSGGTDIVTQIELPEGEVTLESCLATAVDPAEEEEFYGFALALLKSADPKEVLNATKERLGVT